MSFWVEWGEEEGEEKEEEEEEGGFWVGCLAGRKSAPRPPSLPPSPILILLGDSNGDDDGDLTSCKRYQGFSEQEGHSLGVYFLF